MENTNLFIGQVAKREFQMFADNMGLERHPIEMIPVLGRNDLCSGLCPHPSINMPLILHSEHEH